MEGGIQAWHGLTADGPPEGGVAYFSAGQNTADMVSLAWALEENTRLFYMSLAGMNPGKEEADLFLTLARAERHHEGILATIHSDLSSDPVERFFNSQDKPVIEGGVALEKALDWAEDRKGEQLLELAIGLEANAYDRYLKMVDVSEDETAKEVFRTIAKEEKEHLMRLSKLLDQVVKQGI